MNGRPEIGRSFKLSKFLALERKLKKQMSLLYLLLATPQSDDREIN